MARKASSKRFSAKVARRIRVAAAKTPARAASRRASPLRSIISALTSKAKASARKASKPRAQRVSAAPAQRPAPITRTSVVRKPARGPSRRAQMMSASAQPFARAASAARAPAPSHTLATAQPSPTAPPTAEGHGSQHRASIEEQFSIPTGYGDDRIVLMIKDPWWLYAYWEIQPGTERTARAQLLPNEVPGLQSILRVHDVTGVDFPAQPAHRSFDISLSWLATNWYIHTNNPDREFIVEIGILAHTGRFLLLARSNRVTAPRAAPSDLIDEAWMTSDEGFAKLVGFSGMGMGASPAGWLQLLPQQLFSGGWGSPVSFAAGRPPLVRGFWYRLEADLVIHGATEPKSIVKIQDRPVLIRKDGTFSLRLALPEGIQTVTIEVISPDGRQTRTTAPVVTLAWGGTRAPGVAAVPTQQLRTAS